MRRVARALAKAPRVGRKATRRVARSSARARRRSVPRFPVPRAPDPLPSRRRVRRRPRVVARARRASYVSGSPVIRDPRGGTNRRPASCAYKSRQTAPPPTSACAFTVVCSGAGSVATHRTRANVTTECGESASGILLLVDARRVAGPSRSSDATSARGTSLPRRPGSACSAAPSGPPW